MTWDEFAAEVSSLAAKIDFTPDIVVGIARGGIIPATLIARYLDVKLVSTLQMQREGDGRSITADIIPDLRGKHVLLVEDMIETGRSLKGGIELLSGRGAVVKTACLYTMPHSEIVPDYFLRQVEEVASFPWNV